MGRTIRETENTWHAPCRFPLAVKILYLQGDISIRIDVGGNQEIAIRLQGKTLCAILYGARALDRHEAIGLTMSYGPWNGNKL